MTKVGASAFEHPRSNQNTDQSLPSFGSRSDLDMLFATAQHQIVREAPTPEITMTQDANRNDTPDNELAADGGASRK